MFEPLKDYCRRILPFTDEELGAVDEYFVEKTFKRRELLLEAPRTCRHSKRECQIFSYQRRWLGDNLRHLFGQPMGYGICQFYEWCTCPPVAAGVGRDHRVLYRQGSSVCPVQGFHPIRDLRETDNRTYPATIHRHIGIACFAKARRTLQTPDADTGRTLPKSSSKVYRQPTWD